jgi:hypothetical protein
MWCNLEVRVCELCWREARLACRCVKYQQIRMLGFSPSSTAHMGMRHAAPFSAALPEMLAVYFCVPKTPSRRTSM